MKAIKKYWLDILTLAAVATFAVEVTFQVAVSWLGGPLGWVYITFNSAHERIVETIVIPAMAFLVIVRLSRELLKKIKSEGK